MKSNTIFDEQKENRSKAQKLLERVKKAEADKLAKGYDFVDIGNGAKALRKC